MMSTFKLIATTILVTAILTGSAFAERALLTDEDLSNITGQANVEEFKPVTPVVKNKREGVTKSVSYNIFRRSDDISTETNSDLGKFENFSVKSERLGLKTNTEQRRQMNIYMNNVNTMGAYRGLEKTGIKFDTMLMLIYKNFTLH